MKNGSDLWVFHHSVPTNKIEQLAKANYSI